MLRSETTDSGFKGSDCSDLSRPKSYNCQDTLNMKDLITLSKIMSDNVLVEEEPVRNGIKNIELRDLTKLGYERVQNDENGGKELMMRRSETSSVTSASSQSDDPAADTEYMQMKKGVGLLSGVALIVGTMIGSGIFISPKGVLQSTGSVALSLIVWTGCGLVALLGI